MRDQQGNSRARKTLYLSTATKKLYILVSVICTANGFYLQIQISSSNQTYLNSPRIEI